MTEIFNGIASFAEDPNHKPTPYTDIRIVPLTNVVPFPHVPFHIPVTDKEEEPLRSAEESHEEIVLGLLRDPHAVIDGKPVLASDAVVARVIKVLSLPDNTRMALVHAGERVRIHEYHPDGQGGLRGNISSYPEFLPPKREKEFAVTVDLVEETFERFMKMVNQNDSDSPVRVMTDTIGSPDEDTAYELTLNRIAAHAPIEYDDRFTLLMTDDLAERAALLLKFLKKTEQLMRLRHKIYQRANEEISNMQKEQFLQSQIRLMHEELDGGPENSDIATFEKRAEKMVWSEEVADIFHKELKKLNRFNPNSPDYSIHYSYLDTMLSLPWDKLKNDDIELDRLTEDLDRDHFGLEKVKERIIEHIAVLKLRGDMRSPILCLYGPPGVGKTSLCRSIAESINREYVRMSLGGLHDEAEIRGHRKTYIGAMPGRILNALTKCGSNNPVFVLDEIDKIGKDYKGDPAQALLEVLDPEQNSRFHDNYLDIDYDLSKIFFIATANTTSTISAPLLDRMELIDISGYIVEEKIEIAKRHLIPRLLVDHGFKKNEVKFTDGAIKLMIERYTRESGVRKLEKVISKLLRRLAVQKAKGIKFKKTISEKVASDLLGKPEVVPDMYEGNDNIGVVTGLAWTAVGGEILYVESSLHDGKGELTLTGNLGDVMKESATIALQWLRANASSLGIDPSTLQKKNVHIHVPEGAVPKDGPSAGVTMLTSLASALTGRKVKKGLAMTGEMTLRGKVLPVGGIKEKILAAKRAGITEILLSEQNRRDIEEIGQQYLEGLSFIYVDKASEVLGHALL